MLCMAPHDLPSMRHRRRAVVPTIADAWSVGERKDFVRDLEIEDLVGDFLLSFCLQISRADR